MILRTPPQKKRLVLDPSSPVSDRRVVVFNDPAPISSLDPSEQMVCTYHCRQMVKSEFMVALDKAEKQVAEYQSKLEAMNNELTKSEEQQQKCQAHLLFVEQELEASKGREQALQERILKEVNDSQERYITQLKHCSELEVQLKKEVELRKKAESIATSANERVLELEGKLTRLSESTGREKAHMEKELSYLQDESEFSISRIKVELEKMRLRAENYEKEAVLLEEQLGDLRDQLNECLNQKSELEQKLSSSSASSQDVNLSENQTLVKHLQEELRSYETELLEARKIKSFHMNNELLKEKVLEEKTRREKAEMELLKLEELQLNAQKLEDELISWRSLLREIPDVSCFNDIPVKFAALQKEVLESMMKAGELGARVKELKVSLEMAELSKQNAEKDCALAKEKAESSALEVKRLELMLSSVTVERDNLKKEISGSNKPRSGHEEHQLSNDRLVKDLESSLIAKENAIRELENNLNDQRQIINRQHNELEQMNDKLSIEARRIKSLEREGDRLRSEISLLELKVGHGDYSTANTKVLRMVNTLAVDNEAKHTIEALRSELQKTQAKLQAVEELKGQSDAGKIMDADIPEKLAQLKGQIATLEKREERYKAVFAEKISVFRRACCSLFGYKIVMDDQQRPNGIPITRFTLQSIYAQSDDEKLEFDYESGNASILVNEYTSQPEISHQVEIFVKKWNSIPAFTANITMESFNKRTLS
ncbi:Spindle assembly checkpoint component Mad1 protein [Dioscorea alata]|uniref:Spindle assembly checkpoint component Mad1 protein n=1 Tax=Dioscorea alata TaxID=55571 RepID=A0ACB7WB58_DIOAL|nr:Spindle assembly checkpoint component Mad1 protein [Dioscorea alata]